MVREGMKQGFDEVHGSVRPVKGIGYIFLVTQPLKCSC